MKNWIILGFLVFSSGALALAEDAVPAQQAAPVLKQEEITAKIRERLSPLVQAALEKHCGEDCPSFKIDAQYKKSIAHDVLEDLGFSHKDEEPSNPELQSISISVLVHDRVPQASKDALKQILGHIANNETPVPSQIQLKSLNGLSPTLEKKAHPAELPPALPEDHKMEIFNALTWPVSLLILALVAFVGLVLFLKNRRDLIRDQALAQKAEKSESVTEAVRDESANEAYSEAAKLLELRKEDLLWLIEDLALRGDLKSLNKVVSVYQPQDLSSQLKFSNQAMKVLSSLSGFKQKVTASESLPWLKESLDKAHWKRLEEKYFPLSKVVRLSDKQTARIFSELKTTQEKAALLSSLPQEKWPVLLSQIPSAERVELGVSLSRYEDSEAKERNQLETKLSLQVHDIIENAATTLDNLMESFTLYLTETEAQKLWNELSKKKSGQDSVKKPAILSIDSLVEELEPAAAAEIFTTLEIESLGALVHQLSDKSKQRVLVSLPKILRDRLSSVSQAPSEAQLMRARAQMMEAYRRFTTGGSMVQ